MLRDPRDQASLEEAIKAIAEIRILNSHSYPDHFFEVELRKVARLTNDALLNEQAVREYLAQVAPVPFAPHFSLGREVASTLEGVVDSRTYEIYLGKEQIYRPFADTFSLNASLVDRFSEVQKVTLTNVDGDVGAVGWIMHHSYLGSIPRRSLVGGLRIRAGNVQVGGSDILAMSFPEPRFNSWCVGELHVVDRRITPNGRRDDFEPNTHYHHFISQLIPLLRDLTKIIRGRSSVRQVARSGQFVAEKAEQAGHLALKRNSAPYVIKFAEKRLNGAITELTTALRDSGIADDEKRRLSERLRVLTDILKRLQRKKRKVPRGATAKAYTRVLELIYLHSSNTKDAHRLAEKIVRDLNL